MVTGQWVGVKSSIVDDMKNLLHSQANADCEFQVQGRTWYWGLRVTRCQEGFLRVIKLFLLQGVHNFCHNQILYSKNSNLTILQCFLNFCTVIDWVFPKNMQKVFCKLQNILR
jgi:hypothetical protein